MHRYITLLFCATVLFSLGCTKESLGEAEVIPQQGENLNLSHDDVATYIKNQLEETQEPFDWLTAPDDLLWGGLKHGNHYAAIGYQPAGFQNLDDRIHEIDINDEEWSAAREALMELIVTETNRYFLGEGYTFEDLILDGLEEDNILPDFGALILHADIMKAVREHPATRYIDPDDFILEQVQFRGSGGCDPKASPGATVDNGLIIEDHYTNFQSPALMPRFFEDHKIKEAWGDHQAYGQNIGIGIIDVGASDQQTALTTRWTSGMSGNQNRGSLIKYHNSNIEGSGGTPTNSKCTHGTEMIGLAAGPRVSGSMVGAAFQSRVYSHRAANDVVISGAPEIRAIKSAFVTFGQKHHTQLRIISMSLGRPTTASRIRDGVNYAHNRGKLIFCAAGTSTWFTSAVLGGVVFPASMDVVQAVTGVKEYPSTTKCTTCHSGPKVDFTASVQSNTDAGDYVTVLPWSGFYPWNSPPLNKTLGSSPATAMTAGMAAQVWSKFYGEYNHQILARLRNAAEFPGGGNRDFGYGRINVLAATGQ